MLSYEVLLFLFYLFTTANALFKEKKKEVPVILKQYSYSYCLISYYRRSNKF